jgi:hypothetical protein
MREINRVRVLAKTGAAFERSRFAFITACSIASIAIQSDDYPTHAGIDLL